jgi:hypothetical protein
MQNSALQSDKTRYTVTLPNAVPQPTAGTQSQGGILHQVRHAIREQRISDAQALIERYPDLADWTYEREEIVRLQEGHAA